MEKNDNQEELDAEAQAIQDRYKEWVIKKILDHYKIERAYLYFTADSPLLKEDRTQIYFTVAYTNTGTEFLVVGDLNEHGEITAFRVDILEE